MDNGSEHGALEMLNDHNTGYTRPNNQATADNSYVHWGWKKDGGEWRVDGEGAQAGFGLALLGGRNAL